MKSIFYQEGEYMNTFTTAFLSEKFNIERDIKIKDKIEEWHNSDSELKLHEYLGMTWEEYKTWVNR
jgi:hypothetical protein